MKQPRIMAYTKKAVFRQPFLNQPKLPRGLVGLLLLLLIIGGW
jgi:hypothetical protein